ncbi:MAG: type II toxin-antitoxin system HicB family antitoxin [Coriobacteriales bacterium]|jgi:predicted HicB family RNase H-like nuclease|nr:type II toxin-antitoxin system HicB family antitoxin [Coriobacteriales bacterium]
MNKVAKKVIEMRRAEEYTYRVFYSPEDGEFVGSVSEFPSLAVLEEDQKAAFDGIVSAVAFILEDMEASGEEIPLPLSQKTYSGTISLRMPPSVHRRLDMEAKEEGISVSRLINSKLIAH